MRIAAPLRLAQRALGRLGADTGGAAAVEFAVLLPVMLTLYIGGASVTQAISIDRKVTLVSHAVADLTAQATSVTSTDTTNILNAAAAIIAPYTTTPMSVTITSIKIDANGKATVDWSETLNGTKRSGDVSSLIPAALKIASSCLVWGEAKYLYTPPIGYVITGTLTLTDQNFMRPRQAAYSNCIKKT
jgi:Flp pilus assembly protein TadG